jgi:hypothetical protein
MFLEESTIGEVVTVIMLNFPNGFSDPIRLRFTILQTYTNLLLAGAL